jgi:hypothetical protein
MPRSLSLGLLLALGVGAGAGACADPTGPVDFTGTYHLRDVAGEPPPAVVWRDDVWREEILDASITLARRGHCSVSMAWRVTNTRTGQATSTEFTVACTYAISGSTLTMVFEEDGGPGDPATSTGDGLTLLADSGAWTFRK